MNRINALIAELCPAGVPYRGLTDVADYVRGITYNKGNEQADGPVSVLRANNISLATNTLTFSDVKRVSGSVRVRDNQRLVRGDILICAGSGSKDHIGKVAFVFDDLEHTFGGFMGVVRTKGELEPRFLFHLLTGGSFLAYLRSALSTTTINNLNAGVMRGFRIPVPPLEVQRAIVEVLDTFSKLEAELGAELEARKQQYEHYRHSLLSKSGFSGHDWASLIDVTTIRTGSKPLVIGDSGEYPYINAGLEPSGFIGESNSTGDVITIPSRGQGGAGHVGYQASDFWCGPLCYRIESKSAGFINRFLFYYLKNVEEDLIGLRKIGSIPAVNKSDLGAILVPIVDIEEQYRIVAILDKFDALVNDLSIGLPAELAARRQQYEYYRDKLLTFKEAA